MNTDDSLPLEKIVRLPRNVKRHDDETIAASVKRFGWLERITINKTTGRMIAGHGRLDYLEKAHAEGRKAPRGIRVKGATWFVPVHYVEVAESDEEAAALALNRTTELGGWDEQGLADVLQGLPDLTGIGFNAEDLAKLLGSSHQTIEDESDGRTPDRRFNESGAPDQSASIMRRWDILISCRDEMIQRELLDRLTVEGYECRALVA